MKNGFTLLELIVVIGIMGLLGTISIGGYRAATKGMEERSAVDNASQFMHAAYQRALIDRQPTAVCYWNETLQAETDDEPLIVVGKAVAVRRSGRISYVKSDYLYDEFADLNLTYRNDGTSSSVKGSDMTLYCMTNPNDLKWSYVSDVVHRDDPNGTKKELFQLDDTTSSSGSSSGSSSSTTTGMPEPTDKGVIEQSAFVLRDKNGVNWTVGDAYGFEFQQITLPHGYIFGTTYSTDIDNPVAGRGSLTFEVGGSGKTVQISALRPDSSGQLKATKVGTTKNPSQGNK